MEKVAIAFNDFNFSFDIVEDYVMQCDVSELLRNEKKFMNIFCLSF